jgi:hypothetical protein
MKNKRKFEHTNIFQTFSDVALIMLTTFIFLFVVILITARVTDSYEIPRLKKQIEQLSKQLQQTSSTNSRLAHELDDMAAMSTDAQMERALEAAQLATGQGRKEFDIFISGLRDLPGEDLHLVVDATGSMHGLSSFLIPILRVIVIRSGKHLDAITWFSDEQADTYTGSMGEMFDQLMQGAPFTGANETIGDAFHKAAMNAKKPGAYLLLGDEPSDDRIFYRDIPSPVFTLPIGRNNPTTLWEYKTLAENTGGKMLQLDFK